MNEEKFQALYKNTKKEEIIKELYLKCKANYELENIIKEVREYHDNCVNNFLDIEKIDEPQKLAYQIAYEIHKEYLAILDKGEENK